MGRFHLSHLKKSIGEPRWPGLTFHSSTGKAIVSSLNSYRKATRQSFPPMPKKTNSHCIKPGHR
jgi:hypothetical protein